MSQPEAVAVPKLDVESVRREFPILQIEVNEHPLVYLDSAASSQKPLAVLEAIDDYYRTSHANVHRGVHALSTRATEAYEDARKTVARYMGAADPAEVVFTRGTTEAINLVAAAWGMDHLGEGDEVLLTVMEHHSNLVPWQLVVARTGAQLRFVDITDGGELAREQLGELISERTKLVGLTHISNTLGTVNPVREIADLAHAAGALCLVDGAQAAPHMAPDVGALGCDFYAISGHKMCGPTGIGALWGRRELLESMSPYQGGGEMISSVSLESSEWAAVPHKFEAGTPNIADAVGLAAAIRFLEGMGLEAIHTHEAELTAYAIAQLTAIKGLQLYGPRRNRAGVLSFRYGDIHAHDLATILDQRGIAIRAGHHCNQPLMARLGVDATARASLYLYTTRDEIDALVEGLGFARHIFGGIG